jgi:hypothetical protein
VKGDELATPLALVVSVSDDLPFANVPLAPVVGAVNVTDTPLTEFESLSTTVAVRRAVNTEPTVAACGVPPVAAITAATPTVFVRLKATAPVTPATVAVTEYGPPEIEFAVKGDERATPLALTASVSEGVPFANVPLAPVAGAMNVTAAPGNGFESLSRTIAVRGSANILPTAAVCGVPPVAVIVAAVRTVFVRPKLAGVDAAVATAVTV